MQDIVAATTRTGSALKNIDRDDREGRAEVEQFIADRFALMHKANIRHFMPAMLCMRGAQGRPVAACGLRDAGTEKLFLENYLALSIEKALAAGLGLPHGLDRRGIVEVGNLAVAHPVSARDLISALTELLAATAFQWTVFTGVSALRNAFRRLGIQPVDLGPALIEALPPHEWSDWGNYYAGSPRVCAVSISGAAKVLQTLQVEAA